MFLLLSVIINRDNYYNFSYYSSDNAMYRIMILIAGIGNIYGSGDVLYNLYIKAKIK